MFLGSWQGDHRAGTALRLSMRVVGVGTPSCFVYRADAGCLFLSDVNWLNQEMGAEACRYLIEVVRMQYGCQGVHSMQGPWR